MTHCAWQPCHFHGPGPGPDVKKDFSRGSSQVIRSYWAHLRCSPSAGCHQSAEGVYIRVLQFSCSDGCVFSGRRLHHLTLCVFCLRWKSECLRFLSFGQFLYILFPPLDQWLRLRLVVFGPKVFCSSIISIESVDGCVFVFLFFPHRHLLDTRDQFALTLLSFVQCFVSVLQVLFSGENGKYT